MGIRRRRKFRRRPNRTPAVLRGRRFVPRLSAGKRGFARSVAEDVPRSGDQACEERPRLFSLGSAVACEEKPCGTDGAGERRVGILLAFRRRQRLGFRRQGRNRRGTRSRHGCCRLESERAPVRTARYRRNRIVRRIGRFLARSGPSDAANPSTGIPAENLDFETSFRSGWDISPDLALGADVVFAGPFEEPSSDWSIQPFLEWKKYMIPLRSEDYGTESDAGLKARAYAFPGTKEFKGEASVFYHDPVSARSAYALRLSVGSATAGTGFDLLHTEDRSVRAGYESLLQGILRSPLLNTGSASFRSGLLRALPAMFSCSRSQTQPCLQAGAGERTDAAAIASSGAYGSEALGLGLRLLFDNPVFAYFTFTYGVNRRGEGSFRMCGTAGF